MNRRANSWILWIALNFLIAGYLGYALVAPASSAKTSLLPGITTHGHYQIEMDCDACHAPADVGKDGLALSGVVGAFMQDSCNRCHADQLRLAKDTHPAKKFNDPTNAERLMKLDAQNCITCHREHVPEQTLVMGLTMPSDYCWHCHQEVAESRPSHKGMAFDSCATAGCHNNHDNRSLYEKFLNEHFDQPDLLDAASLPERNFAVAWSEQHPGSSALSQLQADAPQDALKKEIVHDWVETAHAAAGVNCSGCHLASAASPEHWSDTVAMETCGSCHQQQTESFLSGRHGMRLASGLSPLSPGIARQPMQADAAHRELTCTACHSGHRFDTVSAAVDACQKCHADAHTIANVDFLRFAGSLLRDPLGLQQFGSVNRPHRWHHAEAICRWGACGNDGRPDRVRETCGNQPQETESCGFRGRILAGFGQCDSTACPNVPHGGLFIAFTSTRQRI